MQNDVFIVGQYEITRIITGGKWKENCYLVNHRSTGEMILFDPGDDADIISEIINSKNGILKAILLTHAHHDHIGAAKHLGQSFSIICYLSRLDARLLRQAPLYAARFDGRIVSVPDKIEFYENIKIFPFADCLISLISTPGHTPGSVCYSFDDFIFVGDTLFYEHVGRTDLPGGSEKEIIESVNKLLETNIGKSIIFPGHGRSWTLAEAKMWWQKNQNQPPKYNRFE